MHIYIHFSMFAGIHKHYTVEEWSEFAAQNEEVLPYLAASAGTSEDDFLKLKAIVERVKLQFICLDVANGYSEHVRVTTFANLNPVCNCCAYLLLHILH